MAEITARKATEPAQDENKPRRTRITKRKALENHARSYFEAMSRRDANAMAEHWSEDGVADLVPLGILRGRDEIVGIFRQMFAALPDLETTVTSVVAGQNEVAVEWRMNGHFSGAPFQGVEPTGRAIELRGIDLLEVSDGEIVTNTAYYDGMAFARGAGLLPQPDSGAERAMKSALNAATRLRRAVADGRDVIAQRRAAA
ncbi:MAG: hypothetical protein QOH58_2082 [Thermoleophilaceae bacterium]|jgi:steroid delta-isomerase-like uncharacterized protein|nr:hypothetical protein [Thermoleophilaceae bacterium]